MVWKEFRPTGDIELIPYGLLRGFRALDTRDPANPYFQDATVQGQPGMDAKFVLRDHFTIDLTANPDFSQIESEDPQITVNQRYAVLFPEKRPFFLENEDFFRTPLNLFFTRSIGDPSAGIRLTGKDGPYAVGLMTSDDRSPGLAVPDYSQYSGIRGYFTIARVSRDIFKQSSVGALYTDWECPATGEHNRIGGVDSRLKLSPTWTFDGQGVTSSSNLNLNCEANLYPFSSGNVGNGSHYAGPADSLELRRDGLHFIYDGTYKDISPGFVSIPGFINRVDIRETYQEADYRFRPKQGWVQSWGPSVNLRYDFDHTGLRLDTFYAPVPVDSRPGADSDLAAPVHRISRAPAAAGFLLLRICYVLSREPGLRGTNRQSGLSRAPERCDGSDRVLEVGDSGRQLLLGRWRELRGVTGGAAGGG